MTEGVIGDMDMKLREDEYRYLMVCRCENTARVFEAGGRKWDVEKAEDLLIDGGPDGGGPVT